MTKKIKMYILEISRPGIKRIAVIFIGYALALAAAVIAAAFSAAAYSSGSGADYRGALLYVMIPCMVYVVYARLKTIFFDRESLFLRKIGFNQADMLFYSLYKLRRFFLAYAMIYAAIYYSAADITLFTLLQCLLDAAALFITIVCLLFAYVSALSRFDALQWLKAALALPAFGFAYAFYRAADFNYSPQWNIYAVFGYINGQTASRILARTYLSPGLLQLAMLAAAVLCSVAAYLKNTELIDKPIRFERDKTYNPDITVKIHRHSDGLIRAFVRRDMRHLGLKIYFHIMQAVLAAFGIYLLLTLNEIHFILGLVYIGVTCFFNSLFIQELFMLDSMFAAYYKKLPLRFGAFIAARLSCSLAYAIWVPAIFIAIGLPLNKINAAGALAYFGAAAFCTLYLCLYFSSVILFYFPDVKRTSLPLCISFLLLVFPYVTLIVIFFGVRKGKKNWRLWANSA